jgi:MoxR-like ATPase
MLEVHIEYPGEEEELAIVKGIAQRQGVHAACVVTPEDLANMQRVAAHLPMADHVMEYATSLARATRQGAGNVPDFIDKYVEWGAGPRASQALVMSARARAALQGRLCANFDDVKAMAPSVLRHRIITNFAAEADGVSTDEIITRLLDVIPTDPQAASLLKKLPPVFKRQA